MTLTNHPLDELLHSILRSLVDNYEEVEIDCNDTDEARKYAVKVAPDDVGRIIGRGGTIANSIRTILRAASPKLGDDKLISFDVVEEEIDNWNPHL